MVIAHTSHCQVHTKVANCGVFIHTPSPRSRCPYLPVLGKVKTNKLLFSASSRLLKHTETDYRKPEIFSLRRSKGDSIEMLKMGGEGEWFS